jgi:hypothetical protein
MKQIIVESAFTLTTKDGQKQHFEVGVHDDIDDAIADHWYVRAHCKPEKPRKAKASAEGEGGSSDEDKGNKAPNGKSKGDKDSPAK